jgi:hypothetical protein
MNTQPLSNLEATALGKARTALLRAEALAALLETTHEAPFELQGRFTTMMDVRLEFRHAASRIEAATAVTRRELARLQTDEGREREIQQIAAAISNGELDTLMALCDWGPVSDGDVPGKDARDSLIDKGLATKVVIKGGREGYQAATSRGLAVYRARMAQAATRFAEELAEKAHV